jgi:hypothetical protein
VSAQDENYIVAHGKCEECGVEVFFTMTNAPSLDEENAPAVFQCKVFGRLDNIYKKHSRKRRQIGSLSAKNVKRMLHEGVAPQMVRLEQANKRMQVHECSVVLCTSHVGFGMDRKVSFPLMI